MAKWAVVVPSNRPDRLATWRAAWARNFDSYGHKVVVYAVEDAPPWAGIPEWIPRRTDMIRSWGLFLAWKDGHDFVVSMDDDVLPGAGEAEDLISAYDAAFRLKWPVSRCLSVGALTGTGLEMRGFPEAGRRHPAAIQYGGWDGVPDLSGETQLANPGARSAFERIVVSVPRDCAVTTCAMNFALAREYVPWCWQLPMLERRYDRWGDIWSGLVQKRLCDLYEVAMLVNGQATVVHDRASDPEVNSRKEQPGRDPHEGLWEALLRSGPDPSDVFGALIEHVGRSDPEWQSHALRCRDSWLNLFDAWTQSG